MTSLFLTCVAAGSDAGAAFLFNLLATTDAGHSRPMTSGCWRPDPRAFARCRGLWSAGMAGASAKLSTA